MLPSSDIRESDAAIRRALEEAADEAGRRRKLLRIALVLLGAGLLLLAFVLTGSQA